MCWKGALVPHSIFSCPLFNSWFSSPTSVSQSIPVVLLRGTLNVSHSPGCAHAIASPCCWTNRQAMHCFWQFSKLLNATSTSMKSWFVVITSFKMKRFICGAGLAYIGNPFYSENEECSKLVTHNGNSRNWIAAELSVLESFAEIHDLSYQISKLNIKGIWSLILQGLIVARLKDYRRKRARVQIVFTIWIPLGACVYVPYNAEAKKMKFPALL